LSKQLEIFKKAKKDWKKDSVNSLNRDCDFDTLSGMSQDILYYPSQVENDYMEKISFPGQFPYTRGIHSNMYRGRLWTMRQFSGFGTPEETNERYHKLMENGQTGLSVAYDMPTLMGYDPDHPWSLGEVGKCGVSVASIDDMRKLFKNINLSDISVSQTINGPAVILLAFYIAIAEEQEIPLSKLRGTLQNDILKEYAARGTYIYPPKPSIRLVTDTLEFCSQNLPKWNPISISGYHIREAGSTNIQELAFTFANGIAYIESAIDRGLDPNDIGQRISFFFNAHNGFVEEIAKFRAARKIWAKIMKNRFKVKNEKAMMCRFHTQTGGSTLTSEQIDNNVIRTTIQALSAVLGGTQSLHTNSKDEALSLPTDNSAKLALRTQQIIASETNIVNHVDPFGGSFIIEELTDNFVKNTFKIIEEIDSLGGSISSIESGWMQNEIARSSYKYQKEIEENKKVIIGVNKYTEKKNIDDEVKTFDIDFKATEEQINNLKIYKQNRDNITVNTKLADLKKTAKSNDNIIPSLIRCIENQCTLGEMSDTLRDVFGEY